MSGEVIVMVVLIHKCNLNGLVIEGRMSKIVYVGVCMCVFVYMHVGMHVYACVLINM